MNNGLYIQVVRDGQPLKIALENCSKKEIIDFIGNLSTEELRNWAILLSGYYCGAKFYAERTEQELIILEQIRKTVRVSPIDDPRARADWEAMDTVHRVAWLEILATAPHQTPKS